ncbi:hypothetical protein WA026_001514 [Henosepilachna vigintioctopunctata]|uniref:Uncharacterized protein n=1 Tax=Henosepilachna vigintioctopunctata TaxID=420089 RepID=A0AAW1UJX3_9CUCU
MKWFAAFVLVIACSGIGYSATLGADSTEQKCNNVPCTNTNSVDFKFIGVKETPVPGKYVCVSFTGNITDLIPTLSTTTAKPTGTPDHFQDSSALREVNVKVDEQCALKYAGDEDLCKLIEKALKDTSRKTSDCSVHDANGAYRFSASFPVAAILFVALYLLQ